MNVGPMATALRNTAAEVRQVNVESSAEHALLSDAAELLRVMARIMEGKPQIAAFGAPGDWGYETELGRAVLALHTGSSAPVKEACNQLLTLAANAGQVVTIEQVPLQPLAMGNYETVVHVRPARPRA